MGTEQKLYITYNPHAVHKKNRYDIGVKRITDNEIQELTPTTYNTCMESIEEYEEKTRDSFSKVIMAMSKNPIIDDNEKHEDDNPLWIAKMPTSSKQTNPQNVNLKTNNKKQQSEA